MNMFRLVMALNNRPGGNSVSWLLEVGVQKNFSGGGGYLSIRDVDPCHFRWIQDPNFCFDGT